MSELNQSLFLSSYSKPIKIELMEKRFVILIYFLSLSGFLFAQKVYVTEWKSEADKIVYVSEWKSEANMLVYETEWKSEAKKDSGLWYFTKWKSEADWVIYFTEWKSEANLIIYYTSWKSEAGWK